MRNHHNSPFFDMIFFVADRISFLSLLQHLIHPMQ
uniref:Uncharacterized protein n=1 Tax=Rhizophora mucronata TaxID=61149 RepID=A0A2P2IYL1_RHIMU